MAVRKRGRGNYKVPSLNVSRSRHLREGRLICTVLRLPLVGLQCRQHRRQKIRIRPLTNGKYKFNFVHTNFTWDILGGSTANNTPLQQYPDNGNAWQQFNLERVP